MSPNNPLILQVHLRGAAPYQLGDEIWQQSLADAIRAEVEIIAEHAGPDRLHITSRTARAALRDRVIAEMTAALQQPGDTYTAPDGIAYTLTDQMLLDLPTREDTLATMRRPQTPRVIEVVRFENLPIGSSATRRAIVRWSDGTESQALAWYDDEILICEGDLVGKTTDELRSLHFRRDRDWLQS